MKKRLCLALAFLFLAGSLSLHAPAASGRTIFDEISEADEDINYIFEDEFGAPTDEAVRVPGFRHGAPDGDGVPAKEFTDQTLPEEAFFINLHAETLTTPPLYRPMAYSINNGDRWRTANDALSNVNFPKLLNRGMTLLLSDKPLVRATGLPEEGADIVRFAPIQERPRTPRLIVNYQIRAVQPADPAADGDPIEYPGRGHWVLTERGGFRVEDIADVQIAAAAGNRIDRNGFGVYHPMDPDNGDMSGKGVAVKPSGESKGRIRVIRTTYFWRLSPADLSPELEPNTLFRAASRVRRITATSEQRSPHRYEIRLNKDGVTNIVCTHCSSQFVKMDTYIVVNGVYAGADSPALTVRNESLNMWRLLTENTGVPLNDTIGSFTGQVLVWRPATERRAASKVEVLDYPAPALTPTPSPAPSP